MGQLEESGMSIGDYAMSLIDSGQVSKKGSTPEVARPEGLPITDVDISDVDIPSSMVEQVLQESFGMGEAPKRETVREPLLSEQELLQEKISNLKSELVETINKLTSLVSEAAEMVENYTGGTSLSVSMAPPKKIRRKKYGNRKPS
jgi:hypothetical protein